MHPVGAAAVCPEFERKRGRAGKDSDPRQNYERELYFRSYGSQRFRVCSERAAGNLSVRDEWHRFS